MSLELALQENTAAIKELIAVWSKLTGSAKAIDAKVAAGETGPITAGGTPVAEVKKDKAKAEPKVEPQVEPKAEIAPASEPAAEAAEPVDFDTLKKAFLALSTKEGGRAKCEGVLKPHGLAKLSEAKAEQYAALMAAIQQASA